MAQQLAQRTIEGNMTSLVRITRGGDTAPVWNPETHRTERPEPEVIWEPVEGEAPPTYGIATIKTVSGPVTMALADEPQYFQSTFISIPLRARQPETDDMIEVLACPNPKLVGRHYRVVDVEEDGQLVTGYRMQVVGIQPGRTWRQP